MKTTMTPKAKKHLRSTYCSVLLLLLTLLGTPACYNAAECKDLDPACGFDAYALRLLARGSIINQSRFVYMASDEGVYAYAVDKSTGTLSAVAGSPFKNGTQMRALAMGPGNTYLYAQEPSTVNLHGFLRNADGTLTADISGSPFSTGSLVQGTILPNPAGTHLYMGASSNVLVMQPSSDGTITQSTGSPFANSCQASAFSYTSDGKFVYATHAVSELIPYWNRSGDSLTAGVGTATTFTGRKPFDHDVSGSFLVTSINSTGTANMAIFNINSTDGSLTEAGTSPVSHTGGAVNGGVMAMTSDGKRVYVVNRTNSQIYIYDFDTSTGSLSQRATTYGIGNAAWDIQIGPGGRFLYVADDDGVSAGRLYAFSIGSDGSLNTVPGSPVAMTHIPKQLTIVGETTILTNK